MTTDRHELTSADVWAFLEAGCNAAEVAEYAGVSLSTAHAMICYATRLHARAAA